MKKISRFIILILTVVMLSLSAGCDFLSKEVSIKHEFLNADIQGVDIGSQESERVLLDKVEACARVKKSVVGISTNGTGAGVILDVEVEGGDSDCIYILTCHHMIASKGDIVVYLANEDGEYYDTDYMFTGTIGGDRASLSNKAVTLVGGDEKSDLAIIKIDLDVAAVSGSKLSNSQKEGIVKAIIPPQAYIQEHNNKGVEQLETVFAIGNPAGELGWACLGEISMLETEVSVENVGKMNLMGIATPTNHGSSGGGLFNLYGELVGITNAGSDEYSVMNYAIPLYTKNQGSTEAIDGGIINIAKHLIASYGESSDNYGYVYGRKEPFGFTASSSDNGATVYISSVVAESQAAEKGMLPYVNKIDIFNRIVEYNQDVITAIKVNDNVEVQITSFSVFNTLMDSIMAGDELVVSISRQYKSGNSLQNKTLSVSLTANQYCFCDTGK